MEIDPAISQSLSLLPNPRIVYLLNFRKHFSYMADVTLLRLVRDRAWFVRLYEIVRPCFSEGGDYRPYRRTTLAQSHLHHDIQ